MPVLADTVRISADDTKGSRAHRKSSPDDLRYAQLEHFVERLRGRSSLSIGLKVGDRRYPLVWPIDFSDYRILAGPSQAGAHGGHRERIADIERLCLHLARSDLDLLTYCTAVSSSTGYLQDSRTRMEWFFAVDYHVDGPATPPALREEVVRDLTGWIADRSRRSRIPWINGLCAGLQLILEDLEQRGIDTSEIRRELSGYFNAFLLEFDGSLSLERYLENRSFSVGMRPVLAFCFAYLRAPLPPGEAEKAERMKDLTAYLVAFQNDAVSQRREERQEQGHLNLKAYFPDDPLYVAFLSRIYRDRFEAFMACRPARPGPLEDAWRVCYQWICGGLVWHLTTRRYDAGQLEIMV